MPALVRLLSPLVLALSVVGCPANSTPRPEPCPQQRPAFHVVLGAAGPWPDSVTVEVTYGGAQTATYSSATVAENDVVCCEARLANDPNLEAAVDCAIGLRPEEPDAAADDRRDLRLVCELWTNGAARLRVASSTYPDLVESLVAEQDEEFLECSTLATVYWRGTLVWGDAGVTD